MEKTPGSITPEAKSTGIFMLFAAVFNIIMAGRCLHWRFDIKAMLRDTVLIHRFPILPVYWIRGNTPCQHSVLIFILGILFSIIGVFWL